jgi:hypothetical protein
MHKDSENINEDYLQKAAGNRLQTKGKKCIIRRFENK